MNRPKLHGLYKCAFLAAVVAALLIAPATHCCGEAEPQLLLHSRVFFDLRGTKVRDDAPTYFWRSRDKLLLIEIDGNGDYHGFNINRSTGRILKAAALNRFFSASEQHHYSAELELSPDGKTLLLPLYRNYKYQTELFDLDTGSHKFLTPIEDYALATQLLWERDGKHWLEMYHRPLATVWDVLRHATQSPGTTFSHICDTGVVGIDRAGNLISCKDDPGSKTTQHLITYCVRTGMVIRNVPLGTPPGASVGQVALSPVGDRILLEVLYARDPDSSSNPSLNPFAPPGSQLTRCAIWVCGINGKGMHEIGSVPMQFGVSQPMQAEWLPDGKSISFIYSHKLWVVPAD